MSTETKSPLASESAHCNNGGCTRPTYRGMKCFRCWAGIKWTSIWQRIQNKNGHNPSYEKVSLDVGKIELINWILENPPPVTMERPSIDRIDNTKGYSLDNIRWLEHRINSRNRQRDTPEGHRKCAGCDQILPLTEEFFSPNHSRRYSPWQGRCRSCKLIYDRKWRANYVRN